MKRPSYSSISTCFGLLCAHHQEKQLCLCDTWYLLFRVNDCLVCIPDSHSHSQIFISSPSQQSVKSSYLRRPTKALDLYFFTVPPKRQIFVYSPSHQSVISLFLHRLTKASNLNFFTVSPKRQIFKSSPSNESVKSSYLHRPTKS
jgi:hypothetical protein